MGFVHSITLPGIQSNSTVKREVKITDGGNTSIVVLGPTDNLISFTATNPSINYLYRDLDSSGVGVWSGPSYIGVAPDPEPEPPVIAPEPPTEVSAPVVKVVEGDAVVVPTSGV